MSSSIEKAAQRLEQLRAAGALLPSDAKAQEPSTTVPSPTLSTAPMAPSAAAPSSKSVHIDLAALAGAGFVTRHAPRSAITDQFRVIKRPLLDNASGRGAAAVPRGNLIMVTSALPGEGKSFTAINLAMSMAMELDHTVMLVDADVARPSVMQALGLPPAPGLLDLLLDPKIALSQVLLRTNIDNLTLLPTGLPHPRATELLASEAMVALLAEMGQRYSDRIIIFDSPPLLLTTEAPVLASQMGQIVMVVQAEKTLQSQVEQALASIEACPIRLLVLNQARRRGKASYGYGYGYGHDRDPAYGSAAAGAATPA